MAQSLALWLRHGHVVPLAGGWRFSRAFLPPISLGPGLQSIFVALRVVFCSFLKSQLRSLCQWQSTRTMPACVLWFSPCNRPRPPFSRVAPVPAICRHLWRLALFALFQTHVRVSCQLVHGCGQDSRLRHLARRPSSHILAFFPSSFDTRTTLRLRFRHFMA